MKSVPDSAPVTALDIKAVYEQEFDYVARSLRRLGVSTAELGDLTHDVFVVAQQKLPRYDPTRPLRPWLFGISFRVVSMWRRSFPQGGEPAAEAFEKEIPAEGDAQVETREARELVLLALRRVGEDRRPVFIMHELDGCPVPEVARALKIPLNTAYSRLRVARKEFTDAVQRHMRGGLR